MTAGRLYLRDSLIQAQCIKAGEIEQSKASQQDSRFNKR